MKDIFKGHDDYSKTAFLNWRVSNKEDISNMHIIAEGFLLSAIEICNFCLSNNKRKEADILIFPILHNANHGIELYLKALVWTLNSLSHANVKIEGKHNILQILQTVQSKIRRLKDNGWLIDFNQKNEGLIRYVEELFAKLSGYGKSDNMDFSRYPITDQYLQHFYITHLDNIEIDLENLHSRLIDIKNNLDERLSYFYYHELQQSNI